MHLFTILHTDTCNLCPSTGSRIVPYLGLKEQSWGGLVLMLTVTIIGRPRPIMANHPLALKDLQPY